MRAFFIIDTTRKEVLDTFVSFEEGEKIMIETDGHKVSYTITSAKKVLQEVGGKYDVSLEYHLLQQT